MTKFAVWLVRCLTRVVYLAGHRVYGGVFFGIPTKTVEKVNTFGILTAEIERSPDERQILITHGKERFLVSAVNGEGLKITPVTSDPEWVRVGLKL